MKQVHWQQAPEFPSRLATAWMEAEIDIEAPMLCPMTGRPPMAHLRCPCPKCRHRVTLYFVAPGTKDLYCSACDHVHVLPASLGPS